MKTVIVSTLVRRKTKEESHNFRETGGVDDSKLGKKVACLEIDPTK